MDLLKSFARKFHIRNISYVILLFFGLFFVYGIFINSKDQNAYTLQQAGIEAKDHYDNPLLSANIVGNFKDTYPTFSFENVIKKIKFYFLSSTTSIYAFSPITIFLFLGILLQ